jgi:hypothetical protein
VNDECLPQAHVDRALSPVPPFWFANGLKALNVWTLAHRFAKEGV